MNYFNIRYECNDARDDYAAAHKAGKVSEDMPGYLNSDMQDELDNIYDHNKSHQELSQEELQDVANKYNEIGNGYINRLKKMEQAKRLIYASDAMDTIFEKR